MLFSRNEIATFVNTSFEPVWESVRPVPIVRIDFGNGNVVTRTLHGNIATYVCTPQGQVLDLAAGIYTPTVYLERLSQFRLLANYVDQQGLEKRASRLAEYHGGQLEALNKNEPPAQFVNRAFISKAAIENGLKAVLVPGKLAQQVARAQTAQRKSDAEPKLDSAEDLANWKILAEDTQTNETIRRRQVHELLSASGLVKPEAVTRRIYKDILHADLDDPYLGLGSTLFANYPFKDEKTR